MNMKLKVGDEIDFIPKNSKPGYKVFPGIVEQKRGCFIKVETWNPYMGKSSPHFHETIPLTICYPKNTIS